MKRSFFTVAFVLLTAVAFGSWPEGYQGDELPSTSCFGFVAEVTDWVDRNPWGMRSPVGFKVIGEVCEQDGVAQFAFEWVVSREVCTTPPYSGVGEEETCDYYVRIPWSEGPRYLPWVQGAYISYVHNDNSTATYEAFIWDEASQTGRFIDGVFDFVTPLWFYESDDYTRWEWELKPISGEVIIKRAVGGRKGLRHGKD